MADTSGCVQGTQGTQGTALPGLRSYEQGKENPDFSEAASCSHLTPNLCVRDSKGHPALRAGLDGQNAGGTAAERRPCPERSAPRGPREARVSKTEQSVPCPSRRGVPRGPHTGTGDHESALQALQAHSSGPTSSPGTRPRKCQLKSVLRPCPPASAPGPQGHTGLGGRSWVRRAMQPTPVQILARPGHLSMDSAAERRRGEKRRQRLPKCSRLGL